MNNKLPKDWKIVNLKSITDTIQYGYTESSSKVAIGPKFLRITDIQENNVNWEEVPYCKIDSESKSKYLLKDGDLVFARTGATVGKSFLIRVNLDINEKYLSYFFQSPEYWKQITNDQVGTGQPNVNGTKLGLLKIVIAPLETQQAIVSKIEELFSELDKGIEDLKTAQQQLKTYRQSVLKWAFEGKLTNENLKDGELPKGWEYVNIEDIAKVGTGATPLKGNKSYYENGKIAWVTSGALNDEFVRNATDYVTELALKETNLSLYPKHTLLLAMYGEGKTRGKCSELLIEATTNQAIAAISFENHDISVKPFLKYFLLKNYNDIRMLSSGGVQPNLNLGIVKKTQLPFPPLEEQHQIVQEIESRLSVANKMEESIAQSLQQAEALRQSILKKAFEGKLI